MRPSEELRRKAIQTITSGGAELKFEVPFLSQGMQYYNFSPDSTTLVNSGGMYWRENVDARAFPFGFRSRRTKRHTKDSTTNFWRTADGQLVLELDMTAQQIAVGPTDLVALETASDDAGLDHSSPPTVELREVSTGQLISKFPGQGPFKFNAEGNYLAFRRDGSTGIWNVESNQLEEMFVDGTPLCFQSSEKLLTLDKQHRVNRWDIANAKREFATPEHMLMAVVCPDGRLAALQSHDDHSVLIWDLDANERVGHGTQEEIIAFDLSRDGKLAYSDAAQRNKIYVWDIRADRVTEMIGSTGRIASFVGASRRAFSSDGSMLAAQCSLGAQAMVKVWDVETGEIIATFLNSFAPGWSGDGRLLATVGESDVIEIGRAHV
jgi:WD40 repeat protein